LSFKKKRLRPLQRGEADAFHREGEHSSADCEEKKKEGVRKPGRVRQRRGKKLSRSAKPKKRGNHTGPGDANAASRFKKRKARTSHQREGKPEI